LQSILQHRLVQGQIGDKPLQLGILFLKLAQPLNFGRHETGIAFAPIVERRLRNSRLAADLADRRSIFSLL
jgi:hypothetical protein